MGRVPGTGMVSELTAHDVVMLFVSSCAKKTREIQFVFFFSERQKRDSRQPRAEPNTLTVGYYHYHRVVSTTTHHSRVLQARNLHQRRILIFALCTTMENVIEQRRRRCRLTTSPTTAMIFKLKLLVIALLSLSNIHIALCDDKNTRRSKIDFTPMLSDLSNLDAQEASNFVIDKLTLSLNERMKGMFEKATSAECRAKIATHFSYFINAIGSERTLLPFDDAQFNHEGSCPEPHLDIHNMPKNMTFEQVMRRKYQPPRDEAEYIHDAKNLKLLYAMLMHGDPDSTIRLIEILYEEGHTFVIHVDGKHDSDAAYDTLMDYSKDKDYVHIVPDEHRVRVNWGGYSMVNAT